MLLATGTSYGTTAGDVESAPLSQAPGAFQSPPEIPSRPDCSLLFAHLSQAFQPQDPYSPVAVLVKLLVTT